MQDLKPAEEKKRKKVNPWWMQFWIAVLGTSIGVGLTFMVSGLLENRSKQQAQRQAAMMVIDDMDKSIATLKAIQQFEEEYFQATRLALDHIDDMETLPDTTLNKVFAYLCEGGVVSSALEFDESVEKMYMGTQDIRMNLSDVPFTHNIEEFYKSRTTMKDIQKSFAFWVKPVPEAETVSAMLDSNIVLSSKGLCKFLKGILQSNAGIVYLQRFPQRMNIYTSVIDEWTNMNEENKFLMNITDREMEEFAKATSRQIRPAKAKNLIGKWELVSADDHAQEQEFLSDHSFTYREIYQVPNMIYTGKVVLTISLSGTWQVQKDSLILFFDPASCSLTSDSGQISYREEMSGQVQALLNTLTDEEQVQIIRNQFEEKGVRRARATNIDLTGNRLELTYEDNDTQHYKRITSF